jgi:predicted DNA-binding WGR domain protein
VSLERLWNGDIPAINFFDNSRSSVSTSNYPEATIGGAFPCEVFSNVQPENLSQSSTFLSPLVLDEWTYVYDTESMIAEGVKSLLTDILRFMNLRKFVRLVAEATLDGRRSDLWMLKTASGIPFLPIECKKPKPGLLEDPKVIGQCHHYMMQLRHSFGQQVVYGIIATLEEWRILYLPNSSSPPPASASSSSHSHSSALPQQIDTMTVAASPVYSLKQNGDIQPLLTAIANTIQLSYHSSHLPVPLLSDRRVYLLLKGDKILWGTMSESSMKDKYIKFNIPNPGPQLEIKILRRFLGGADGVASLGLTQNLDLVVVKKFTNLNGDNPKAYDNEQKYWPLITGQDTVPLGIQELVLPFAFTCLVADDGIPYFDFDLNKLGSASQYLLPDDRFTELSNKLIAFSAQHPISPQEALRKAVGSFAKCKCVHEDIKWRHVALLPQVRVYQRSVTVTGLSPILIDLSRVHDVATVPQARAEMSTQVSLLLDALREEEKDASDETRAAVTLTQTSVPQVSEASEVKLEHTRGEYYHLSLFLSPQSAGWSVSVTFGQTNTSGQQRTQDFDSQDGATQWMNQFAEKKRKEGFHDVVTFSSSSGTRDGDGTEAGAGTVADLDEERVEVQGTKSSQIDTDPDTQKRTNEMIMNDNDGNRRKRRK